MPQAKTAATTLRRNLCFNLPRAGFNFNDGLGGGDEVHQNLIFNTCRETSDHGPINSWDRQPYVSTFGANGSNPTAHMIPRNISYNFLVCSSPSPSLIGAAIVRLTTRTVCSVGLPLP